MSVRTKNPLHPSALALNDMQVGVPIIQFNRHYGIILEGVILSRPYTNHFIFSDNRKMRGLVVLIRDTTSGYTAVHFLEDLGVIPYAEGWNKANFTVNAKKRDLLPELSAEANPYGDVSDDMFVSLSDFYPTPDEVEYEYMLMR